MNHIMLMDELHSVCKDHKQVPSDLFGIVFPITESRKQVTPFDQLGHHDEVERLLEEVVELHDVHVLELLQNAHFLLESFSLNGSCNPMR